MGIGTIIFGGVFTYLMMKAFTGESSEIEGLSEFTERQALIRERKREMRKLSKEIDFAQRLRDMDDEIAEGRQMLEALQDMEDDDDDDNEVMEERQTPRGNRTPTPSRHNNTGARPRPPRPPRPRPSREDSFSSRGRDIDM